MKRLFLMVAVSAALLPASSRARQPQSAAPVESRAASKCPEHIVVDGAVRQPMHVEPRRAVRLAEVLAMAGGMTEDAGRTVVVNHPAPGAGCAESADAGDGGARGGGIKVYDLNDVREGKTNPSVVVGDTVSVMWHPAVYVMGSVVRPQGMHFKGPLTISQAVAAAGGLAPDAAADRVNIYRRLYGSPGVITMVRVNLKAIMKGRAEDLTLQHYDVVEVPSKKRGVGHSYGPFFGPATKEAVPVRVIY